jgi:choline dehydrogenase-like flavoprotein
VIPMLTRLAAPVSIATQGNTLAQVYLELEGGHVSGHALHLQIYGYNDIMLAAVSKRLPLARTTLERFSRPVLGRLVVIQGFLHSTDSPGLTIRYDDDRVHVAGDDVAVGARCVKRLVRRLASHARLLGMAPIPGLVHVGRPGKSNHVGGSMRMQRTPRELETDVLGRIHGWERVHVVDSSVFPSIPATTVTLSVMANAHRIAAAVAKLGS